MAGSWDFSDVSDDVVDIMTCSELSIYLTTNLQFPVEDIKELESKLIRIVHTHTQPEKRLVGEKGPGFV